MVTNQGHVPTTKECVFGVYLRSVMSAVHELGMLKNDIYIHIYIYILCNEGRWVKLVNFMIVFVNWAYHKNGNVNSYINGKF